MRILKSKHFHRWAHKEKLTDVALVQAINEMNNGLYETNLGGNIYKKRVAIQGRGKRGGARTIVAFKMHGKAFFIYGFTKNKRDNVTKKEEEALKELAKVYLGYDNGQIDKAVTTGNLIEVCYEEIDS